MNLLQKVFMDILPCMDVPGSHVEQLFQQTVLKAWFSKGSHLKIVKFLPRELTSRRTDK